MGIDLDITEGDWEMVFFHQGYSQIGPLFADNDTYASHPDQILDERRYKDRDNHDNAIAMSVVPQFKALADEVELFLEERGYDVELVNVLVKLKDRIKELKNDDS